MVGIDCVLTTCVYIMHICIYTYTPTYIHTKLYTHLCMHMARGYLLNSHQLALQPHELGAIAPHSTDEEAEA